MSIEKTFAQKRAVLYVIGFIFNLGYALPAYINSSFLSTIISEKLVGIIYTASSILAIAAFIEAPWLWSYFPYSDLFTDMEP
jgi:hypothetical protein